MPAQSRTRVVFLQHPRERRVAIGTARMAHLALPNSELHVGVDFSDNAAVASLLANPDARPAVLFPGEGARDPSELEEPPTHLFVVDGTWTLAKKLLLLNPVLQSLPRVGLAPRRPGNYRIRKEPAAHCLATIEAVVEVLGALERDYSRFEPMLGAFEYMVDRQIACASERTDSYRRRPMRPRQVPPPLAALRADADRLVVVHGEANAHPREANVPGSPELLQLVAERLSTGERFEAFVAPRRPLSPSAPHHLDVEEALLLGGVDVEVLRERWRAFAREDDVCCGWGSFGAHLLGSEGLTFSRWVDLKALVALVLNGQRGGVAEVAEALGAPVAEPWARGRAGRSVTACVGVIAGLVQT